MSRRSPRSTSRLRAAGRTLFIAALTVALLAWFIQGVDLHGLWRRLVEVHRVPLALSLAFATGHYFLRAWRWRYLLLPLGEAPYGALLSSTVAGYAVNNVLPGRAGEVARPLILSRRTEIPFSGALATVVLERLLDAATLAVLFLVSLPFVLAGEAAGGSLRRPLLLLGLLALLAAAGWAGIRIFGGPLGRAGRTVLHRLPVRLRERVERGATSFLKGFAALGRGRLLAWVVAGSFVIWLDIGVASWFAVRAFEVPFSYPAALFFIGWLAVGISAPTPAGIGGYDAAGRLCLTRFFGLAVDLAAGITLVLHAVSVVPVTLWGLVVLWQEGVRLGSLRDEAEPAGETDSEAGADTMTVPPDLS